MTKSKFTRSDACAKALIAVLLAIIAFLLGRTAGFNEAEKAYEPVLEKSVTSLEEFKASLLEAEIDRDDLLAAVKFWESNPNSVDHISIREMTVFFYMKNGDVFSPENGAYLRSGTWEPELKYGKPYEEDDTPIETWPTPVPTNPPIIDAYSA